MALTTIGLMALLGCFTGFLAGLLGIGGGMIITPFLIMLIPSSLIPHDHIVHVAIATSLATIAFTSLSSVRAHHKRGAVLWNVVASDRDAHEKLADRSRKIAVRTRRLIHEHFDSRKTNKYRKNNRDAKCG